MSTASDFTTPVNLVALVGLILALSVASERLVEIVKGWIPWLSKEKLDNDNAEWRRKAVLQALAVVAGMLTAYLAKDSLPDTILPKDAMASVKDTSWWVFGLLASGGSGFWNAVLGYVTKVKEIKKAKAESDKMDLEARRFEFRSRMMEFAARRAPPDTAGSRGMDTTSRSGL